MDDTHRMAKRRHNKPNIVGFATRNCAFMTARYNDIGIQGHRCMLVSFNPLLRQEKHICQTTKQPRWHRSVMAGSLRVSGCQAQVPARIWLPPSGRIDAMHQPICITEYCRRCECDASPAQNLFAAINYRSPDPARKACLNIVSSFVLRSIRVLDPLIPLTMYNWRTSTFDTHLINAISLDF